MHLQAKQHQRLPENHKKLGEAGKMLPYRFQRERSPADTLMSDVQPPELGDNELLLLKPPGLCSFVTAAVGHTYRFSFSIWKLTWWIELQLPRVWNRIK